jgi:hypothetical protein
MSAVVLYYMPSNSFSVLAMINVVMSQPVDDVLALCLLVVQAKSRSMASSNLTLQKGDGRLPPNALPSAADFVVQLVDFFQGKPLGFIDKEVHKGNADETGAEPNEKDLGLEVCIAWPIIDEVRRCKCESPVEEPLHELVISWSMKSRERCLTLVAVVMERLLARVCSGKISPVTTQAIGPQVDAKKKI